MNAGHKVLLKNTLQDCKRKFEKWAGHNSVGNMKTGAQILSTHIKSCSSGSLGDPVSRQ